MSESGPVIGIIGADGRIGKLLYNEIQHLGLRCFRTSRRFVAYNKNTRFFDIVDTNIAEADLPYADIVYICIGIPSFKDCEDRPKETFHLNVTKICEVVFYFLKKGSFVIFISSSSVFSGDVPFPNEDFCPEPSTIYGMQKYKAELGIMKLAENSMRENVGIVRITKLISKKVSIIDNWQKALSMQAEINPVDDLFVSPISERFVSSALLKIGLSQKSGIFHLSNRLNISYSNLAYLYQSACGYNSTLIRPKSIKELDIDILFRPKFPGLGMLQTKNKLNIMPQSIESFIDDLRR